MTRQEKQKFITDLCQSVQADVLSKVDKMPLEWDGFELRELLADSFRDSATLLKKNRRRYREYLNTRIVLNL